jgi:hypothetical protein
MKIIREANKTSVKMLKSEWEKIGKKSGWITTASKYEIVDSEFNRRNYPDMIGKILDSPPAYANVRLINEDKPSLEEIFHFQSRMFLDDKAEHFPMDFVMKALKVGYEKNDIIEGLGEFYRQAPDAANSIFNKTIMKIKGFDEKRLNQLVQNSPE